METEQVFNLREIGCSQWTDQIPQRLITTYHIQTRRIEYSVQREEKQIGRITTTSRAGDAFLPLVVILFFTVAFEARSRLSRIEW
jgi:hypothetical protein